MDDKQKLAKKQELVDTYTGAVRALLDHVYKKRGDDIDFYKINQRFNTLLKVDEYQIMKVSGPYLLKYRKMIADRNVDFFKNIDYDQTYGHKKSYDPAIIVKIRTMWEEFAPDEKENIIDKIQEMLVAYCDYKLQFERKPSKQNK